MNHNTHHKESNKSLLVVIGSLVFILAVLFGLNSILTSQNKNNTELISNVSSDAYMMGDKNAKVRLVEYADFQCPACKMYSPIIDKLYKDINAEYGSTTLSIAYKYFPLIQIHKNAMISAESAEAASKQGKFWEMHDVLFEKQEDWSDTLNAKERIEGYAREMGLDMARFVIDRDAKETVNKVEASYKEGVKVGINHTPTIYLNGIEAVDVKGYEGLKAAILGKAGIAASSTASTTKM